MCNFNYDKCYEGEVFGDLRVGYVGMGLREEVGFR